MRLTEMKISTELRWVQRRAFAMMEILVAIAVIGVVFLGLYVGLSSGFGFVQLARENLRGTQILQEKMETIRLYTWDQIETPNFIPSAFTENFFATTNGSGGLVYTGTVTIASAPVTEAYSNDLKKVTINVQWKSGRVLRNREMVTFVAKNGLQSYIY